MKALKKDPIYKKILSTRNDYVDNDMFDPNKRKFLLKRLLEDQGRFPISDQWIEKLWLWKRI